MADYEYELRADGTVVATGRIQLEEHPSSGDVLRLGRRAVHVEDVVGRRLILVERAA